MPPFSESFPHRLLTCTFPMKFLFVLWGRGLCRLSVTNDTNNNRTHWETAPLMSFSSHISHIHFLVSLLQYTKSCHYLYGACFSQIIFLKRKTISNPIFTLPIDLHFSFDLLHLYCLLLLSVGIAPHCFMPCVTSDICIFDSYSHRLKCFFSVFTPFYFHYYYCNLT